MTTESIPAGYRRNAKGHLVEESLISPIDTMRDQLVMDIVEETRAISRQLLDFKMRRLADIAALVELSAGEYKVRIGGKKGNVTLLSFNGRFKVLRVIADNITFDERLHAAKALIDECLNEWSEGSPAELRLIVQDAFDVDKQGHVSTGKILALRRYAIKDERWQRAMVAIGEAVQVVGTKPYIRVYELDERTGKYVQLSLDVAGVC